MAGSENAFAVYSLQKRSESKPLDWAQFGYFVYDSVYVAAGKYYDVTSCAPVRHSLWRRRNRNCLTFLLVSLLLYLFLSTVYLLYRYSPSLISYSISCIMNSVFFLNK
jgi:hypothetical protein